MSDAARVKEKENGEKRYFACYCVSWPFRTTVRQICSIPWKLSNQFVQSNHHYGEWVVDRSRGTWLLVKLDSACLFNDCRIGERERERECIFSFEF